MENTVCVNSRENLKWKVQVADMVPFVRKPPHPLASSMLLWFHRLSFLKPQWSYVNWSQSGSCYCFRATQDSPGVALPRLWLHAPLNPASPFLASNYWWLLDFKIFFSFSTAVFKLARMKVSFRKAQRQRRHWSVALRQEDSFFLSDRTRREETSEAFGGRFPIIYSDSCI